MPFYPPFKKKYEKGDLVYGISELRAHYSLRYDHFTESTTTENISTIDQYAATTTEMLIQHTNKRIKPINQNSFLKALSSHPKYKSVCGAPGYVVMGMAIHAEKVVARKCKNGLDWAAKNKICIHFILDEINMKRVVEKSHKRDRGGIFFTGCELRWIYRNRHNPLVMENIQFWYKGEPTIPPWNGINKDIWQQYSPRSDSNWDWSSSLSFLFQQ
ncbi:hypothetical protein CU788_15470 [Salmonella enterica]|nr:hypothetical protein [Salmonella enterica]EGW2852181.1 hypothetical protein [Salmonella enterica]